MASVFDKIRTLVLSSAHNLLDAAIDLNSIGAVRQHIRDLEEALEDMEDSSAQAAGGVRTVQREVQTLEAQTGELDSCIGILLSDDDPSNDTQALPLQARFDALEPRLMAKREELSAVQQVAAQLGSAVSALRAKHVMLVEQVNTLEAQDRAAKAKAAAADTLGKAGRMLGDAGALSVDDIAARIRKNADVADVKFDRAMQGFGDATGKDAALATAAARLAQRKAALAAQKASVTPPTTPASSATTEPAQPSA